MNKAEIRKEIEKRVSNYSIEELFSSTYFRDILEGTVIAVCEQLGRIPTIKTMYDEESFELAHTNGLEIMVNTAGPIVREIDTNWGKYLANIGHTLHECGHVLFTPFCHFNKLKDGWASEPIAFYPKTPSNKNTKRVVEILNKYPYIKLVFIKSMNDFVNIMEDRYVNDRLSENFSGLALAGLESNIKHMGDPTITWSSLINDNLEEGNPLPMVINNICFYKYKCKNKIIEDQLTKEQEEVKKEIDEFFKRNKSKLRLLIKEKNGRTRCQYFNELFIELFDLLHIEDNVDNSQQSDNAEENESSSECKIKISISMSSEQAKTCCENNQENMQKLDGTAEPKGDTDSVEQKQDSQEDEDGENQQRASQLASSKESIERELEKAIKTVVSEEVIAQAEQEHENELTQEAKEIDKENRIIASTQFYTGYELKRLKPDKEKYQKIYVEVKKTSDDLVRKIKNVLKAREEESDENGYLMGQRFNARDVVNRDGKYFSRQNEPDGKPKIVFGVLIDESGSMDSNQKFVKARKIAILLEDTLRRLETKLLVVGHTNNINECTLYSYVDPNTVDGKDKYRLARIEARSGNIDGAAITYMGDKLLKCPEQIKVLIVISDGKPAGMSYYSKDRVTDTKLAIAKYRKKGVRVFGAVVDDYEDIKDIYSEEFCFDCRTYTELEKQLVKLIKRFVLAK